MSSISPLVPVMQRINRLKLDMAEHPLNLTSPFLLMTQLIPGDFSLHISWLQRLDRVRVTMMRVAILRELRRPGDAYRGDPGADWILRNASNVRMDMMEALMALCDMAAPCGGNLSTLVEWLNGHLDRLEALWEDHQQWLERRQVLLRVQPSTNNQIGFRSRLSSVSTAADEETGVSLLRTRRVSIAGQNPLAGEEVPLFCTCGQCGLDNNPGDCASR